MLAAPASVKRLPGILPTLEPGEALALGMDPVDPGGHPLRLGPAVMTNTLGIAGSVCGGLLAETASLAMSVRVVLGPAVEGRRSRRFL